jgi:uncharacterized repeat protein (TIGR01451 family)
MKWFFGVLLLLFAALVLESGLLAYAMYVLLALLILSRLLAISWMRNLHATRQVDYSELEVGDTVSVQITVANRGVLPVGWVLLEDLLPARTMPEVHKRVRVKSKRLHLAMIASRGRTELHYQVQFKGRGYFQIGPLVLETGDFFGLHRRYRVGTEPHFVLVYPRVVPLEGYELTSRRPVGEIRMAHRLYEDPTRIAGVRQYQAGDPLNRVHWRATARTGTLHCKIYEPSTVAGATVLLDLHRDGYPSRHEPNRSELAVTTAASLAFTLYQMGQQIGLITNGRDAAERIRREGWAHDYRSRAAALASANQQLTSDRLQPLIVPTRRGPEQFQQIWATLARAEISDGLPFSQLIAESEGRLPRDATILALLPRVPVRAALALGNLRRRGFAVTAILIMLEEGELQEATGRLLAERIEVRHVANEEALASVCRQQVLR